jgi:hypothetical protein
VQGTNYARFQNVQPDTGSKITVTLVGDSGTTQKRAYLSGWQLLDVAPLLPSLSLTNLPASAITTASAMLGATLRCTGTVYQVSAFWNTVSGGTNAALWTNSAYVGSWTNLGSTNLSYAAMGLNPNRTYYFTFRATNAVETMWATNVLSFTTLTPPAPAVANTGGATNLTAGVAQRPGGRPPLLGRRRRRHEPGELGEHEPLVQRAQRFLRQQRQQLALRAGLLLPQLCVQPMGRGLGICHDQLHHPAAAQHPR